MSSTSFISRVQIEGLYDQFDIELDFKPGLNILYGKNGRGKTTLLHILANTLELDFRRFSYLNFRNISITLGSGGTINILKEYGKPLPIVSVNSSNTSFCEEKPILSEAERANLREVLGGRSIYLPAFRSVLERARNDYPTYYGKSERRDSEFDDVYEMERRSLKELSEFNSESRIIETRGINDKAANTAQKTMLCRQWFGPFVPVIRYPSVADASDALTDEWKAAHIEITRKEQRMFEEIFVKIFRSVAGIDRQIGEESNEKLLTRIDELLQDQESQLGASESKDIYAGLRDAVRTSGFTNSQLQGIDNSLLEIYRQVLENRNLERRSAFMKTREFEASINKFLDRKKLFIGSNANQSIRMRNAISIVADGGRSYGLHALSSGERQILTMLYSASRAETMSGVFLIDEPELSLHIDWQRIVLKELYNQASGRQVIACTHSPEVGADHLDAIQNFEPKITTKRQGSLFPDEDI